MKILLSNFKNYHSQLVLGPLFKLAEAILELFIPLLMANIIDIGIKNSDVNYIISRGALMLVFGALGLLFAIICQHYAAICAFGFGKSLRLVLYKHIFSLSQKEVDSIGKETLITRATNDVTHIQTGINIAIRLAVRAPFLAIGSVIMAFIINVNIGFIFLAFTPIVLFVIFFIMKKTVPMFTQVQKRQDDISKLALENIEGARVIRAFSRQTHEQTVFEKACDKLANDNIFVGKISAVLNPLTYTLVNFAIIGIIYLGAQYVNIGFLLQGEVIALVNYMTQTLLALIVLANVIVICTRAVVSAKRVTQILEINTSINEVAISENEKENAPIIKLSNVDFRYNENGETALQNINFEVLKGQTIGIIGSTGSGKSTLANLILRKYDPENGQILLDGVDIKNYTLNDLRKKIAIVPQNSQMLSGTIKSNLLLGSENARNSELFKALEIAQAKEFVLGKSEGLDAVVSEGGKNFSGGQKQRICIARTLLAKSQVLILDDATSALDYATDMKFRKALKDEYKDRTVLMITQRAANLVNADSILVLDDGNICGFAKHEQLLLNCEVYKEICISQGILSAKESV